MSDGRMTKTQKELLRAHAVHFCAMSEFVRDSTDEELRTISEACEAASNTNCGWDTYAAAKYLLREAKTEMEQRASRALPESPDRLQSGER